MELQMIYMTELNPQKAQLVIKGLEEIGIEYLPYLPCSSFRPVFDYFLKKKNVRLIMLSKEEEGIGLVAGLQACGKKAVLVIQDSGLGNALNAYITLVKVYKIPILILAARRGGFGEVNETNAEFGEIVPELIQSCRAMGFILDYRVPLDQWSKVISRSYQYAHLTQKPIILLINLKD